MSDEEITESSALTGGIPRPRYAFESSIIRQRTRRLRQFQCCVCTLFISVVLVAMAISFGFSISNLVPGGNDTDTNNSFVVLLGLPGVVTRYVNESEYKEVVDAGKAELRRLDDIEMSVPQLDAGMPSYKHQKAIASSTRGRELSRIGFVEEFGTKLLKINRGDKVCYKGRPDDMFIQVCNTTMIKCSKYSKFRTYNGTCNNLQYPTLFGVAYTPYRRLLPPDYADGISAPRISSDGTPLPSARTVSLVIHRPYYRDDPNFTVMLAVFGQFLDHDITATAPSQKHDGNLISCCSANGTQHPECFPVPLDRTDPFYQHYNVSCMEFVRSAPAPTCCFGPREQLNQATSFIDASVVYGSDEEVAKKLRSFQNGELKMLMIGNRSLLPVSDDINDGCNKEDEGMKGRYCFMTGDSRANENLHLTSMHLIWARQHNRIAKVLAELNPHWGDERLYQEVRKIIGAQMQHITYMEFLPIVLSRKFKKLKPLRAGYYNGYDDKTDSSVTNGFAAAAFRFAHTLIPTLIKMIYSNETDVDLIALHKMLFDPFKLYQEDTLDGSLRGAMEQNIQAADAYFTPELKEHMFEQSGIKLCGLDLVSLNIQRGRDHGIPGYTSWCERCSRQRPRAFDQLAGDIDGDSLDYIQSVYRHVDDIDLYTGALSERPIPSGFLGPTITCVLYDQFLRLKIGDRFFYENPGVFTPQQLQQIRKTSLAGVICDNSDGIGTVQPKVMERPGGQNRMVPCREVGGPDWRPWKETVGRVGVPSEGVDVMSA